MGSVPRLGPRVWHLYLLLEQPATATALSGATALGRDSVLAHLRTLKEHGLARHSRSTSGERLWERTPGLPQDLEAHALRVLTRHNASRDPLSGPALTESAVRLQGRPVPPRPSTRLEKAGFAVTVAALLLALLLLAFL